jgi:hypothetical protein
MAARLPQNRRRNPHVDQGSLLGVAVDHRVEQPVDQRADLIAAVDQLGVEIPARDKRVDVVFSQLSCLFFEDVEAVRGLVERQPVGDDAARVGAATTG